MNTLLEKLFEQYHISPKDRYEINQIYGLLPTEKKQNLLNNFEALSIRLNKIEEDLNTEREILIWEGVENIRKTIIKARINKEKKLIKIK